MTNRPAHRHSIRLSGCDYAGKGGYFLTLCTCERVCLFGNVVDGAMRVNTFGEIVRQEWWRTAWIRPGVSLYPDEFVVMPNHLHGIIWILASPKTAVPTRRRGDPLGRPGPHSGSIGAIVGQFKSQASKRINEHRGMPGAAVWQRNYYEHIIRGGESLNRIRRYIADNPARWAFDRENPHAVRPDPDNPWANPS